MSPHRMRKPSSLSRVALSSASTQMNGFICEINLDYFLSFCSFSQEPTIYGVISYKLSNVKGQRSILQLIFILFFVTVQKTNPGRTVKQPLDQHDLFFMFLFLALEEQLPSLTLSLTFSLPLSLPHFPSRSRPSSLSNDSHVLDGDSLTDVVDDVPQVVEDGS